MAPIQPKISRVRFSGGGLSGVGALVMGVPVLVLFGFAFEFMFGFCFFLSSLLFCALLGSFGGEAAEIF